MLVCDVIDNYKIDKIEMKMGCVIINCSHEVSQIAKSKLFDVLWQTQNRRALFPC